MSKNFSFSSAPILKKRRSRFDLSHKYATTMSVGYLYPVLCQEVLPGDTFKIKSNVVIQCSSSFLKPVIDNLYAEEHFFFVPNRLVSEWEKIMGENKSTAWAPASPTVIPRITPDNVLAASGTQLSAGTVGDYLGLPLGIVGFVSAIPFRSFAKIYDEWFRDQNNIAPMSIQTGAEDSIGGSIEKFNSNDWSPNNYTGKLPHVKRMADYFSTALPEPQKGSPVEISVSQERFLPVSGLRLKAHSASLIDSPTSGAMFPSMTKIYELADKAGYNLMDSMSTYSNPTILGPYNKITVDPPGAYTLQTGHDVNRYGYLVKSTAATGTGVLADSLGINNLVAYDDGNINPISMDELVYALALQKMLIKDAIGGTRYAESLLSHWGVVAPDQRLQRPEYLGGRRFPITISQVAQTVPTEDSSLGNLGAYSLSNGEAHCIKGFVEHGYIFGVLFIRQIHSYNQGVERHWSRRNRVDVYDPCFANIGQQPIYKRELFAGNNYTTVGDTVFGYKEPWAEYKYGRNTITGSLRPDASNSLDIWTFTDDYANAPSLNASFVEEDPTFVDRSLAVPSSTMDQFIVDIWFDEQAYRVMPVYSKYGMV